MVKPDFFDVTYAINPHMLSSAGQLQVIDKTKANEQWQKLSAALTDFGLSRHHLAAVPNLPDMVFSANQMFPFYKNQSVQFVLSRMKSSYRQEEVFYFENWLQENKYEYFKTPEPWTFEGMGDAIWNYETREVFGGYGFRTDRGFYDWLEDLIEAPIVRLHLINESFYHLDTALCILNATTALVVADAFSQESYDKLRMKFKDLIVVNADEAQQFLAANACSLDGRTVFVERGALRLQAALREKGFRLCTFDTSEYLKSGGSLFCLKLLY